MTVVAGGLTPSAPRAAAPTVAEGGTDLLLARTVAVRRPPPPGYRERIPASTSVRAIASRLATAAITSTIVVFASASAA